MADYIDSGFSPFLTRSIDDTGTVNLDDRSGYIPTRQVNYDQNQVTGSLGDILQIGLIHINGAEGRISIFDENKNEVVRLGEL